MTEIVLQRQDKHPLTPAERRQFVDLLTRMVDGFTEGDKRALRAVLTSWNTMAPGELSTIDARVERLPETHRRHMSMETKFFQAQDAFEHERAFRDWLKVGACWVDWQGKEGELVAVPKSINYTDVDELAMREIHLAMVAFLRKPESAVKLWPHLTSERARHEMVEGLLKGYGE